MHSLTEQNYIQQLSIDCVIFGYENQQLKVLISTLKFKGDFQVLPSGFIYQGEDVDEAARRILEDRTSIKDTYLEQFHVFGKADRSNRAFLDRLIELNPDLVILHQQQRQQYEWFTRRFVSIGYYALVDMAKVIPQKHEIDQSITWYDVRQLPILAMDHNEIVQKAIDTLRLTLDQRLSAFSLLPESFTMKDVQEVYEAIYDKPFARNNFQKKILDMNVLERLEKKFTGAANKAPYLYRYIK
ncbi:NUDIX hydrolase [Spirosoma sp. BT702]|uniref:NUDIX hydrolase n=1 Tax=Spirosoma profusum TaxID=2771354 RepID=A0A927ARQ9_9BACT|nr:NUDIX domain-containing protein [Spirosoma profusum]MBD2702718.1 NUDIX hydrolase [Spirosoma profusum]